jgi:hypothetical protein
MIDGPHVADDLIRKEDARADVAALNEALTPILRYLQEKAADDADLRSKLRLLGETFIAFAQAPTQASPAPATEPATSAISATPTAGKVANNGNGVLPGVTPAGAYLNGHAPLVRENLRVLRTIDQTSTWRTVTVSDDDLPMIAERCRLKAEGARWAGRRQQLLQVGADYDSEIEPNDRDIIARAKMLPECFLWMCHRDGPTPDDLSEYETLAGCFEGAAAAMTLLYTLLETPAEEREGFTEALELAAESQSALRVVITEMGGNTDSDQYKIFQWLKQTGAEQQILIRRYMRKDDPADPMNWQALIDNVHALEERIESNRGRTKRQRSTLNRIRYHLKLIDQNPGQDRTRDWQKVLEGLDELVTDGLPPSNRELRDLLLPHAETIPESLELSKNVSLVLRELEQYLTSRPSPAEVVEEMPVLTEEVRQAAELLRGRTVVLIGGLKRPLAAESLTAAFALKELVWVEGRDQTYADFEPYVARPDVAVVILAIRWSRHGFGEVKEFCDTYDKPLVRLPGGYSPNQVALHIMSQVAERLGGKVFA